MTTTTCSGCICSGQQLTAVRRDGSPCPLAGSRPVPHRPSALSMMAPGSRVATQIPRMVRRRSHFPTLDHLREGCRPLVHKPDITLLARWEAKVFYGRCEWDLLLLAMMPWAVRWPSSFDGSRGCATVLQIPLRIESGIPREPCQRYRVQADSVTGLGVQCAVL